MEGLMVHVMVRNLATWWNHVSGACTRNSTWVESHGGWVEHNLTFTEPSLLCVLHMPSDFQLHHALCPLQLVIWASSLNWDTCEPQFTSTALLFYHLPSALYHHICNFCMCPGHLEDFYPHPVVLSCIITAIRTVSILVEPVGISTNHYLSLTPQCSTDSVETWKNSFGVLTQDFLFSQYWSVSLEYWFIWCI